MILAAPSLAQAAPDWVGDFDYEGQYSGRIQVDPGDMSPSGHSRNEVVYVPDSGSFEGSERWYSISLRPEAGTDWADTWHLVFYWEGNPVFASVMSAVVVGPQIQFRTFLGGETQHWAGAFTPGVWQEFILHVLWSPDPMVGFVELYVDDVQVVPITNVATMHGPGVPNELHTGILRNDAVDFSEVVYIDGVRAGATMEDVMGEQNGGSEGGADSTGDGPGDGSEGGETSDPNGETSVGGGSNDSAGEVTTTNGGPSATASEGSATSESASDGGDDGGCGCRTGDDSPLPWLASLLGLIAFWRRPRRK